MSLESEEFIGCSIDGLRDRLYAFNSQQNHDFGFFFIITGVLLEFVGLYIKNTNRR